VRKRNLLIGAAAFVVIVGSFNANYSETTSSSAASPGSASAAHPTTAAPSSSATLAALAAPTSSATAAATPTAEAITVTKVIDGDSLQLADGREIRLLGIDSCEASTYGGKEATSAAESALTNPYNQPITMTAEPGVDLDPYDRHLRYVQLNGYDFGESMVKHDHTGVYQGKHDASPQYVRRLYAADAEYSTHPPAGRYCDNC
jgi:endonuclease YncB( thermonuclease family)